MLDIDHEGHCGGDFSRPVYKGRLKSPPQHKFNGSDAGVGTMCNKPKFINKL